MPPGSHVHIISAGDRIHLAYPAMLRTLPTITHTYVLADSSIREFSPGPETQRQRTAVRDAMAALKETCSSLSIPFSSDTVYPPVYPSVRTLLTKIHREHPGARFTLDLSGGSAALCTALFSFAPWLGGEVYSAFDGKVPGRVPVPDSGAEQLLANPNYQTILSVLLRRNREKELQWMSRSYLFSQVWPYYLRSRIRKPDPGAPVVTYRKGRKPANNLSQATFSSFMTRLRAVGFIEEQQDGKNRKEKAYRITETGDAAFRFFAQPALNSSIMLALGEGESGPGS